MKIERDERLKLEKINRDLRHKLKEVQEGTGGIIQLSEDLLEKKRISENLKQQNDELSQRLKQVEQNLREETTKSKITSEKVIEKEQRIRVLEQR